MLYSHCSIWPDLGLAFDLLHQWVHQDMSQRSSDTQTWNIWSQLGTFSAAFCDKSYSHVQQWNHEHVGSQHYWCTFDPKRNIFHEIRQEFLHITCWNIQWNVYTVQQPVHTEMHISPDADVRTSFNFSNTLTVMDVCSYKIQHRWRFHESGHYFHFQHVKGIY